MAESGLWSGKTLRQWLPAAVGDVVSAVAPRRIVLFGSVARGEEAPDNDLDLLVVRYTEVRLGGRGGAGWCDWLRTAPGWRV